MPPGDATPGRSCPPLDRIRRRCDAAVLPSLHSRVTDRHSRQRAASHPHVLESHRAPYSDSLCISRRGVNRGRSSSLSWHTALPQVAGVSVPRTAAPATETMETWLKTSQGPISYAESITSSFSTSGGTARNALGGEREDGLSSPPQLY